MLYALLYDISNDKARTKVYKLCHKVGLHPLQLSFFLGMLNPHQKDSLILAIEDLIDATTDKVYIFSLDKAGLNKSVFLGKAFDEKLVTDQVNALWL